MSNLADHIPSYAPALRKAKDRLATATITAGGAAVLLAIVLIFFYLLYEVLPLFGSASVDQQQRYQWRSEAQLPLYLAMEEQGEIGIAIDPGGQVSFFKVDTGALLESVAVQGGEGVLTTVAAQSADSRLLALGYTSGELVLVKHDYRLSYPNDKRLISPSLNTLYTEQTFSLGDSAIQMLAVSDSEDALVLVASLASGDLVAQRYQKQESFLSDEVVLEREFITVPRLAGETLALYIGASQRWVYRIGTGGHYTVLDLTRTDASGALLIAARGELFAAGAELSSSSMLLGGISLLAASNTGELAQYFMVRESSGHQLVKVRSFDTGGAVIQQLLPEHRRKGFHAISESGQVHIFHSTSERLLLVESLMEGQAFGFAALSPRGDKLFTSSRDGEATVWHVDNEHPDVSWSVLWQEVWYESYDEPAYVWQSSASNNDFEPKFSFSPLAFGTLKAAFYTMLIAAPMAIFGAIYTAYFMAPGLRRKVKPLIELMEALPTVILGFLAGLWLAPFIENQLTGVFTVMLVMPAGIVLFAFLWSRLPLSWRSRVPDGYHALTLMPVILLLGYICFASNDTLELWLFGGDMRVWITTELGISFDQRNALVVGMAMGMAVIPTIFSIAEDAIFSVPRHLSYGSLALGATPWQTLVGVVIPTASPGIFSALMIGMGRAVGETMIVLMATGNTPIMDANIFEGMRTLSANIAVEIPEAEVNSTHYRVLFLAAFVLFLFTFVVNTVAELIRQRLRLKYGSL